MADDASERFEQNPYLKLYWAKPTGYRNAEGKELIEVSFNPPLAPSFTVLVLAEDIVNGRPG